MMRISKKGAAELAAKGLIPKGAGRSKYHAIPVPHCPHCKLRHASQAEAGYCAMLDAQKRGGDLWHYDVHPIFTLPGGIRYSADFLLWWKDDSQQVVEVKGMETGQFRDRRKLFDATHPLAPLVVVRGRKRKGVWTWEELD